MKTQPPSPLHPVVMKTSDLKIHLLYIRRFLVHMGRKGVTKVSSKIGFKTKEMEMLKIALPFFGFMMNIPFLDCHVPSPQHHLEEERGDVYLEEEEERGGCLRGSSEKMAVPKTGLPRGIGAPVVSWGEGRGRGSWDEDDEV
ncbi:hypothetical protein L6452_37537 [Arctium lappa]|uniref:Uncharacterized protein n=1 Tax=Arctium lappa TaxID=4217 RepID=A0ACB8Y3Z0_ARCLA|nr:hypothetical protein L6452_37537 [Arctium lappa]